jgi:hypothetical protein
MALQHPVRNHKQQAKQIKYLLFRQALMGASVRTSNEALRAQWHVRLLMLEHYERARARGEIAGEGRPKTVSVGKSLPDTAELGLSRKRLTETRKVARAGGLDFADSVINEARPLSTPM